MKKLLSILTVMLMLFSVTGFSQSTMHTISITPNKTSYCAGDVVVLNYYVNPTSGNFLSSTYCYIVKIGPNPFCNGTVIGTAFSPTVTVGGINYLKPYSLASPGTATVTIPSGLNGNYTIGVTVSQISNLASPSGSNMNADAQPITVYSLAPLQPNITGPISVCSGVQFTLSTSSPQPYSWNTGATTSAITPLITSQTTYSLTTSNACGNATATHLVSIIPTPTASISPLSQTICSGSSVSISALGGTSYVWSTAVTAQSINVQPTSNTSYYAVVSNACGSSNTSTVTVTVNPVPTPSISISASATICAGSSATLTVSGTGSYVWSTSATTSVITVSPTAFTTYSVTETNSYGCSSTVSQSVQVNPLPTANAGTDQTVQSGNSVTLNAIGTGSYSWSNGATTSQIVVAPTVTTTYTLTVTNQCGSAVDSVVVTVIANPTGIFENTNRTNRVSLFPNPANNEINIVSENLTSKDVEVNIFDIVGNKILSKKIAYDGKTMLDISQMNVGNYIVEVSASGFHSNAKLIIVR